METPTAGSSPVLLEVKRSHRHYIGPYLVGTILLLTSVFVIFGTSFPIVAHLGFVLTALLFFVIPFVAVRFGADWTMTQDALFERVGIISRRTSEVRLADIRNIQVAQGIGDRILGIGSVSISTAGQSGMEVNLRGVGNPRRVADRIRAQWQRLTE